MRRRLPTAVLLTTLVVSSSAFCVNVAPARHQLVRDRGARLIVAVDDEAPPITSPFAADAAPITSPFTANTAEGTANAAAAVSSAAAAALEEGTARGTLELTVANVDAVLEKVRPYLIADGGNIAVLRVDPSDMSVHVALQGACGSCPSATTTMKMGVEKTLREVWPDLGEVVEVAAAAAPAELTMETAHEALAPLLPAIAGLGGSIRVVAVWDSTVELQFTGPEKIKFGVDDALRDSPLITNVVWTIDDDDDDDDDW